MPILAAPRLLELSTRIFERCGASAEHARCVAEHLINANLAGHDSHGVLRVPQYVEAIAAGTINPRGTMQVVSRAGAIAVVDGQTGFGQVIARDAMLLAIEIARGSGIGAVSARNLAHTGRIGTYARLAAERGVIGIAMVNTGGAGQSVAPFGGIERRLATNPIAIGAPVAGGAPLVSDFASSVAPEGKVRYLHQAGRPLPAGWIIDAAGQQSTDAADFYADPPGSILPLGGPVGHKGFALAFMIDILAGALGGAGCSRPDPGPLKDGLLTIALDIGQFTTESAFAQHVATLIDYVKSCPTAPGVEQIQVPGEVEEHTRRERSRDGIYVTDAVWEMMEGIRARLRIEETA